MLKLFTAQKTKNNNPNLLFLLVTGTSTDKDKLAEIGKEYRGMGKLAFVFCFCKKLCYTCLTLFIVIINAFSPILQ